MLDLQPTVGQEGEDGNWGSGPPSQAPQPHSVAASQSAAQTYCSYVDKKFDAVSLSSSSAPQRRAAPANRFASLSDFNRSEDEDDDEGRQNFFAGGEKSFPANQYTILMFLVACLSKTPRTHPPQPKMKSATSSVRQWPTQPVFHSNLSSNHSPPALSPAQATHLAVTPLPLNLFLQAQGWSLWDAPNL